MSDFLAVAREPVYSPGKVEQDRAILEAVAARLSADHTVRVVNAEEQFDDPTPQTIVFAMCQGPLALDRLRRWEQAGIRIVNAPQAIENCHRRRMLAAFEHFQVPHPASVLVSTSASIVSRTGVPPFEQTVDFLRDRPSRRRQRTAALQGERKNFLEINDDTARAEEAPLPRGRLEAPFAQLSTVPEKGRSGGILTEHSHESPLTPLFQRGKPVPERKSTLSRGGRSEEESGVPGWENGAFWLKRGDVHAMQADDVVLVHDLSGAHEALRGYRRRGIADALIQQHVEGDIVKFYAVRGGFFHWLPINGDTLRLETAEERAMADLARRGAAALGLEVYGGDCVRDPSGRLWLIDLNDWPSYGACRMRAAEAIAAYLDAQTRPSTT